MIIYKFTANSTSGYPTLDCELVQEGDAIHLDYTIIAPFTCKGEKRRQSWCWGENYPWDRLLQEASVQGLSLSNAMWGEK